MGPQGCHSSGLGQVIFFTSVRVNSTRTGTETMLLLSAVGSSDQVTMLGLGKLFQGHGCNPCKCLSLSQKQTAGLMEVWKSRGSGSWGEGLGFQPTVYLGEEGQFALPSSAGNSTSLYESDPHRSNVLCSSKPQEIWPEPAKF